MRKVLFLLLALGVLLVSLSGCTGNGNETAVTNSEEDKNDSFNVSNWLDNLDNKKTFNYITVREQPGIVDKGIDAIDAIKNFELDGSAKDYVMEKLRDINFDPIEPDEGITYDFAFGSDGEDPFMFFSFTDDGLVAKVPLEGGKYQYYKARVDKYTSSLNSLRDHIGSLRELRQNH